MKNNKWHGNRLVAICGVFIALSMMLSYIESLIPVSAAVPGIKLGLANIVTIIALNKIGVIPTIIISAGRIILSGILLSNPAVILYSLAGAAMSILVMVIFTRIKFFSVTGISILGGIFHNLGQLIVACIIMENFRIMYYFIVLFVVGAISGAVIGLFASYLLKTLRI